MRLVLLIEFRHRQTPRKNEQKKQYSHTSIVYDRIQQWLHPYIYTQNERCHCLYPFPWNWRFRIQNKAKNAFYISGHFSSQTLQRYAFFFTMQRSNENILSSKLNIFLIWWKNLQEFIKKYHRKRKEKRPFTLDCFLKIFFITSYFLWMNHLRWISAMKFSIEVSCSFSSIFE